ncbi:MAG: hypothetical protein WKG07_49625 [Hymenobacter sp.]
MDSDMYEYLMDNGMTRDEYHFFLNNNLQAPLHHGQRLLPHQRAPRVAPTAAPVPSGEIFGYHVITTQYHDRYRLPVMHTETNLWQGPNGDEAVNWLWKEWANVLRVRNDGVPIVGFTWYSLTDQVDWDTALRENNGNVNPLGLYDLDRNIRPVGEAYKQAHQPTGSEVLPTQSAVPADAARDAQPKATRPGRSNNRPTPKRRAWPRPLRPGTPLQDNH